MAETRIYRTRNKLNPTEKHRLVEAGTRAQALGHVVRGTYEATPASPKEVAQLMSEGIKLETAGAEPEAEPV